MPIIKSYVQKVLFLFLLLLIGLISSVTPTFAVDAQNIKIKTYFTAKPASQPGTNNYWPVVVMYLNNGSSYDIIDYNSCANANGSSPVGCGTAPAFEDKRVATIAVTSNEYVHEVIIPVQKFRDYQTTLGSGYSDHLIAKLSYVFTNDYWNPSLKQDRDVTVTKIEAYTDNNTSPFMVNTPQRITYINVANPSVYNYFDLGIVSFDDRNGTNMNAAFDKDHNGDGQKDNALMAAPNQPWKLGTEGSFNAVIVDFGRVFLNSSAGSRTCSVALSTATAAQGQAVTATLRSSTELDTIVRTFIKRVDNRPINPAPAGTILAQNGNEYYYQLTNGSCSGPNCTGAVALPSLPNGSYQLHCDIPAVPACSGNPNCTYEGGSTACTGFKSCSNQDNAPLTITAPISRSCQINLTKTAFTSDDSIAGTGTVTGSTTNTANETIEVYVKKKDNSRIAPAPAGTTEVANGGMYYYKVNGSNCTMNSSLPCNKLIELQRLPAGQYSVHCQIPTTPGACSGNPNCSYKTGGTIACTDWKECSAKDSAAISVVALPTPTIRQSDPKMTINCISCGQLNTNLSYTGVYNPNYVAAPILSIWNDSYDEATRKAIIDFLGVPALSNGYAPTIVNGQMAYHEGRVPGRFFYYLSNRTDSEVIRLFPSFNIGTGTLDIPFNSNTRIIGKNFATDGSKTVGEFMTFMQQNQNVTKKDIQVLSKIFDVSKPEPELAGIVKYFELNNGFGGRTINFAGNECACALPTAVPTATKVPLPPLLGDIDRDNDVDYVDYGALLTHFGASAANGDLGSATSSDLDKNNTVDIYDYTLLILNYGRTQ